MQNTSHRWKKKTTTKKRMKTKCVEVYEFISIWKQYFIFLFSFVKDCSVYNVKQVSCWWVLICATIHFRIRPCSWSWCIKVINYSHIWSIKISKPTLMRQIILIFVANVLLFNYLCDLCICFVRCFNLFWFIHFLFFQFLFLLNYFTSEFSFIVMVCPVGSYYRGGKMNPLPGQISHNFDRAAPYLIQDILWIHNAKRILIVNNVIDVNCVIHTLVKLFFCF